MTYCGPRQCQFLVDIFVQGMPDIRPGKRRGPSAAGRSAPCPRVANAEVHWSGCPLAHYPGRKLRSIRSAWRRVARGRYRLPVQQPRAVRVRAIIDQPSHAGCPPPPLGPPGPVHGMRINGCGGGGVELPTGPPGPPWQFGHNGGGSNGAALTSPTPNVNASSRDFFRARGGATTWGRSAVGSLFDSL